MIHVWYLHDGLPVNHIVSVTELSHARADGVTDCIQSSMSKFGLDNWKKKLVGFCADGPKTAGVVAKKSGQFETDRHSMDGSQAGAGTTWGFERGELGESCKDTFHLIWKTYHLSPKSNRELKIVCEELESMFYKPKPVKGTRWVPQKDDLVSQAGQYAAVAIHMENLAQTSHNATMTLLVEGKRFSNP